MPSTFYIVKSPLALGNIFNWTEFIMAQSHDDAKDPYWGPHYGFLALPHSDDVKESCTFSIRTRLGMAEYI